MWIWRSGKLFSHEWAKIKPDIMSVAKGIGSVFHLELVCQQKSMCCND